MQSTHAAPEAPHAVGCVPAAQVESSLPVVLQHEPLQASVAEHVVTQACVLVLHEPPLQSAVPLQPQLPPPVTATHADPTLVPVQLPHAPPDAPHAVGESPVVHSPLEQQPPLQSLCVEPPHEDVHWWVVVSHAWPAAQSVASLQPHVPPPFAVLVATHAVPPSVLTAQLEHIEPARPHTVLLSLGSHVPAALQQVPLHG